MNDEDSPNALHIPQKRQQGIDVIKTIAMFMVLTLHILSHGEVFSACKPGSSTLASAALLESVAIVAVNLFVLASGYLGYGSAHRLSKVIELWFQILFWSICFGILFNSLHLIPRDEISFKQLLFPVLNNQNWYICTYFALLPFMPVLDKAVLSMTSRQSFDFVLFGTILLSVFSFLAPVDSFGVNRGYSLVWFMFLYLVGAMIRANETTLCAHSKTSRFALMGAYAASQITTFLLLANEAYASPSGALSSRVLHYNAPAVFIAALALFMLLIRFKIKNTATAKSLATVNTALLDVYLIHEHPLVRSVFIAGRFSWLAQYGPIGLPALVILTVAMIFSICITLGYLRHRFFNAIGIRIITNKVEQLIMRATGKLLSLIEKTFE